MKKTSWGILISFTCHHKIENRTYRKKMTSKLHKMSYPALGNTLGGYIIFIKYVSSTDWTKGFFVFKFSRSQNMFPENNRHFSIERIRITKKNKSGVTA